MKPDLNSVKFKYANVRFGKKTHPAPLFSLFKQHSGYIGKKEKNSNNSNNLGATRAVF